MANYDRDFMKGHHTFSALRRQIVTWIEHLAIFILTPLSLWQLGDSYLLQYQPTLECTNHEAKIVAVLV